MGRKRYNLLFGTGFVVLLPRVGDVPQGMQDVVLRLGDDGQHLSETLHSRGVHCTKHVRVYVSAQEGY